MVGDYKDLILYQKAKEDTLTLFRYYKKHKLIWSERFLIEQMLRAASSIGANVVEGYGRPNKPDYRRFIGIARGSALEVEYWIDLVLNIRPQDRGILTTIRDTNIEVIKILTTFMKKLAS